MNRILQQPAIRFLILLGFLILCYFIGLILNFDLEATRKFLSGFPIILSGIIFIVLYTGITFFVWFGTIDVFRISASILFGAYWATLFVWIAELINAYFLFHISRKLGQEFVLKRFKLKEKDVSQTQSNATFLNIFTLRINPLVPFRVMDIGYGLTRVSFGKYIAAISLSSLLRIFWLQLILDGIGTNIYKDSSAIIQYLDDHPKQMLFSSLYLLLVLILSLVALVVKLIQKNRAKSSGLVPK